MLQSERRLWAISAALAAIIMLTVFPVTLKRFAQVSDALAQVTHSIGAATPPKS